MDGIAWGERHYDQWVVGDRETTFILEQAEDLAGVGSWITYLEENPVRVVWSRHGLSIFGLEDGATFEDFVRKIHPEDRPAVLATRRACLELGSLYEVSFRLFRSADELRWIHAKGTLRTGDGPRRIVGVFRDVTDDKRAEEARRERLLLEEQIRHAQKLEAVGRLAAGVSHDFNNMLMVISSYTTMALDALKVGDPMRDDLEEIRAATDRATELTRQLLAFSRQQVMTPAVIDLGVVVGDLEKMLRRLLGEDIHLALSIPESLDKVFADPGQITQVIMNLAVNARDAMPTGGTLAIELSNVLLDETAAAQHPGAPAGAYVSLTVADTGVGMTPEIQARIFEPFFTTKERGKGTGLGLSMVFGIVKQSGGHVGVHSEPGRGARFTILLPRTGRRETARASSTAPTGRREQAQTILLVEDDPRVRRATGAVLRYLGHDVIEASNGGDALLVCEQPEVEIDLMLCDVVMPRMSGPQLLARLAPLRPSMKVIFMSGYADDSIVHHGLVESRFAFVQKPITPRLLAEKIREVMDSVSDPSDQ